MASQAGTFSSGTAISRANNDHSMAIANIEVPNPSALDKLLESRLTLSESQIRMARDAISSTQSSISHIDDELARLQASVNELQHKRAMLERHIMKYNMLLAPSRRLPPEILSEIFIYCMQAKDFNTRDSCHIAVLDKAPLLVSQICREWRNVALSTPRLWASFALTIRPKFLKNDVLLAKSWLRRSGTCPLSIDLTCAANFQNPMRPLIQVLLPYCERWYNVQLSLPLSVIRSLAAAKNRFSKLRRLFIGHTWSETIDIFEHTPQLRTLRLDRNITLSMVKVPWNQIQYCDTGARSTDRCLEIFRSTPNLEGCMVSPVAWESHYSTSPVQLSHLQSMTLRDNPVHLLDKLLVPELREVLVHLTYGWIASQQLISLLSRCSVQILSFYDSGGSRYDQDVDMMIKLLQASHTLVELELRESSSRYMSKSFLAQFAHHDSENPKVPRLAPVLHTMRVDYTPSYFDITEFVTTLRSRTIFHTLKTVEICLIEGSFLNLATKSRLQQLRAIGLDISVIQK